MMRIFAGVVGVVLLLFGLIVTYLQYGNLRPHAEWAAAELLKRELRVEGRFEADVWPVPRILVENVSLANASWGSEALMLQAGHLSARVDAWSLLSGPIRLLDVRARDVEVLVESSADGQSNWSFADSEPSAAEPEAPASILEAITRPELPVVVERAEADDVGVTVRTRGETPRRLVVRTLNVALDETGRQDIDLDAVVTDVPLKLEGWVARSAAHDVDLMLAGALGPLELDVRGILGLRSDLVARISADDLDSLLDRLDVDLPLTGRFRLNGRLVGGRDGFEVEAETASGPIRAQWRLTAGDGGLGFRATIGNLAELRPMFDLAGLPASELRIGGRLVAAGEAIELHDGTAMIEDSRASVNLRFTADEASGSIDAAGPRLSDLGFDLPDVPFRLTLNAARQEESVALYDIELDLGRSDLAGSIALTLREPFELTGRLRSDRLDLAQLLPGTAEPSGQTARDRAGEADSRFVFASSPLPIERLIGPEVDLELRVAELVQGHFQLTDLSVNGRLADGDLRGELAFRAPAGGTVQGTLALRARGTRAHLALRGDAANLRANLVSGEEAEPRQIPPVGLSIDLESEGGSPRELAASASGRVVFTQGPGRIVSGAAVPWLSGDLLTQLLEALNPFHGKEPYSDMECSVVRVELEDGRGEFPVLLFQNRRLRVVGEGTLDLRTERLQVEFNTQPREGVGVGADMFVTPFVMLAGTLAEPSIEMNKEAVLLRGGAALLSGGLTILGKSLIDRARGQRDSCANELDAAADASRTDVR